MADVPQNPVNRPGHAILRKSLYPYGRLQIIFTSTYAPLTAFRRRGTVMADKPVVANQIDLMFRASCDRTRYRRFSACCETVNCAWGISSPFSGFRNPRCPAIWLNCGERGMVVTRRTGLWVHYSLAQAKTAFHRKLLECVIASFHGVPEIKSDNARAKALRNSEVCCP